MSTKIFLVGMPGAGKTTLGQQLAKSLEWPFVDLDHEIESRETKTIAQIFTEQGETAFRLMESEVLKSLSDSPKSLIIATGGGAPCFHENMELMNLSGKTLFIDPEIDVLVKRVSQEHQRPLFHGTDVRKKLEELYQIRASVYGKAHIHLRTEKPDLKSIVHFLELPSD